jgi:hypothetical protein
MGLETQLGGISTFTVPREIAIGLIFNKFLNSYVTKFVPCIVHAACAGAHWVAIIAGMISTYRPLLDRESK